MAGADLVGRMGPELERLLPLLDERARRLVLGAVARAAGEGGTAAVAAATGASWQTVANGAAELASGDSAPPGRVRRPGAGRRRLADQDPGLVPALRALVEESTRGDPCSPLLWTTLSVRDIAGELARQGHRCGKNAVARLLAAQGFSLQGNSKTMEGRRHPDRDAQFRHINERAREFLAAGDPVISVDTKKKEPVGQYGNRGRCWRPQGEPVRVRDHDFPDPGPGVAIPYGIYDVAANAGFVNVGTDHDTPAFAVESVRRWWDMIGKDRYPGTRRLLITCDAGGSNDHRKRAWKAELAKLAAQAGLEITCCHFPPGTSKWNKIEHRLFCHISRTWRARPLASHQVIIDTIAATTTAAGLTVTAALDIGSYPPGAEVSDEQMKNLEQTVITRHAFHGGWNYTLAPVPRPAPAPAPAPPAASPWLQTLTHPALTGMSRAGLDDLVAALELPSAAAREQRLHLTRGKPRTKNSGRPATLTLAAAVTAALCQHRLGMPCRLLGQLLGTDPSTVSLATRRIRPLLDQQAVTLTPATTRITSLDDLHRYAAAAGITIPAPAQPHTPPESTLPARHTPRTNLISGRVLFDAFSSIWHRSSAVSPGRRPSGGHLGHPRPRPGRDVSGDGLRT
jgi:Rhodopirellula transposase DDE domain